MITHSNNFEQVGPTHCLSCHKDIEGDFQFHPSCGDQVTDCGRIQGKECEFQLSTNCKPHAHIGIPSGNCPMCLHTDGTLPHPLNEDCSGMAEKIEEARKEERERSFTILHRYAMNTTDAKTLDLIEKIQKEILSTDIT